MPRARLPHLGHDGEVNDLAELVELSLTLGRPEHDLVILAEGNASAATSPGSFAVKASGVQMAHSSASDFVELAWEPLVAALRDERVTSADASDIFAEASPDGRPPARPPSTETFMHAVGYAVCGASFVAHTHPTAITALLSSTITDDELRAVLFPDEAVVGGVEPVIVEYVDPGLELGRSLLREVEAYQQRLGRSPRVALLKNHGVVTIGQSSREALAATLMATKAARVRIGALSVGGLRPLPSGAAEHLAGRPDEQARLSSLFGGSDDGARSG